MTLSRRKLLRIAGGAAVAMPLLAACRDIGGTENSTGDLHGSGLKLGAPFSTRLPIPAVLSPSSHNSTTDFYHISASAATVQLMPGVQTEIWGYNGTFPGPTLVGRQGRKMVVTHHNGLTVPTVVHLHGGRASDHDTGYPTDYILPASGAGAAGQVGHAGHAALGQTTTGVRDYTYPHDQPAATLWYHDHRMDFTGPQVWKGMAGFHIIHDSAEEALPLPKGDRDIPLMICDRSFNPDGSLWYPSIDPSLQGKAGVTDQFMAGVLGDVILVNGVAWPYLDVANVKYRFRILNASNARRYKLALNPAPPSGSPFVQVASDVGMLGKPLARTTVEIAQAERYEVIVDFSKYPIGTEVTLENQFGSGSTVNVMKFRVTSRATDDSTIPAQLGAYEQLSRGQASITRNFDFDSRADGWAINGKTFDEARTDVQTNLNAVEIWRLNTDAHHPVHLHAGHFQVLGRNGRGPGEFDVGWKDTVDVLSGQETEIIVRFSGYSGKYVFHCHNLEHEDMAMMANLQIT
jgi:spore coat protein A